MAQKVIFLTTTGAGTWTVPSDWTSTNKVECIGGGGGGRTAAAGGGGGGGGAYSSVSNIATFTAGSTVVNFSVGAAGTAGTAGGDTWFGATTLAASLVGAKGGSGATSATGAAGGASASGFPTSGGVRNSGGAGGLGNATIFTGGGGGGAGGPGGVGGIGGAGDATAAGADFGGGGGSGAGTTTAGGAGGAGTTAAGAGGTNASGGGTGGAGGNGAGVAATAATGMWTSTHAANGTTTSVAGAATGGGGGGGGSAATGSAGAGAAYGGGGGGCGVTTGGTSGAGQGIIIITYTSAVTRSATKRFRYNFSDLTKIWQDSAKTTPITGAGDPIGYVADAYGLGIDIYQQTSTQRPILRYDNSNYRYYAEFDGVDDCFLSVSSTQSLNFDEFVLFIAYDRYSNPSFNQYRLMSNTSVTGIDWNSNDAFVIYCDQPSNNFTINANTNDIAATAPDALNTFEVGEIYKQLSSVTALINGVAGTTDTTFTAPTADTRAGGFFIGSSWTGPSSLNDFYAGRIYSYEFDGTSGISSATRDSIRAFHSASGSPPSTSFGNRRTLSMLGTRTASRQVRVSA